MEPPSLSDGDLLGRHSIISKITLVFVAMLVFQGKLAED
jgi:hypothetical protein